MSVSLCILGQAVWECQYSKQYNDGEILLEISFIAVASMISSTLIHLSFIFKKSLCTTIARNSVLFPVLLMFRGQCMGHSACPSRVHECWEPELSEHGRP